MKKAISSVFKGKSSVGRKFGESEDGFTDKEYQQSTSKSTLNLENLSEIRVHSLPPTPVTKMKSSTVNNTEKSERSLQRQVSANSSSVHHFSSQDLLKEHSLKEFSHSGNEGKISFKSSINANIDNTRDSRLQNAAKEQGLSVTCAIPTESEVENEGIVTTPSSTSTSPTLPAFKKYEHRKAMSAAKEMFVADGIAAEKTKEKNQEISRLKTNGIDFEEKNSHSTMKARMESANGMSASKICNRRQDQMQIRTNDKFHQQSAFTKSSALKLSSENISSEKKVFEAQKEQKVISQGMIHEEKNVASSSSSKFISKSSSTVRSYDSSVTSSNMHQFSGDSSMSPESPIVTEPLSPEVTCMLQDVDVDLNLLTIRYDDRVKLDKSTVNSSIIKIKNKVTKLVEKLKNATKDECIDLLKAMYIVSRKVWSIQNFGYEIGFALCNLFRNTGVLDILIANCSKDTDSELQLLSAQLLEQNLSAENRSHVIEKGFFDVISLAYDFCCNKNSIVCARIGTGILEHMFKHSEETCKEMIKSGALKAILYKSRATDVETLRHCAAGLTNLALFGGPENQATMIDENAPMWLFPLAFNHDDNIKYFACLATAVLVANKEIESSILHTGTLGLVESFVFSHNPQQFATNLLNRIHGQSKNWLLRLVPVLDSDREEAKSLAAFHFVVEAWIRKIQGNTSIFHEFGAVDALKRVASSPAIASKFAAQALKLIGEEVPHKLSLQVPLWTVDDVKEWVKQIGFSQYCTEFLNSRVDGDLLLQLNEDMLKDDINIRNGILRKRFMRELRHLKRIADYSSCDSSKLCQILNSLGNVYAEYTYCMLQSGVDSETMRLLSDEQLLCECKIENSIHRFKISEAIKSINQTSPEEEQDSNAKCLDVFISYRRSNGSQLASLLKVHLQLRGFTVFIDVERLEAGNFDSNLVNSIKQAKHFILVLTPSALDRCVGDNECKDWVHKEIVEALRSKCDVIPILDNFQWPEPETLPEDMRDVCYFNGVRWIHEYQDACVDKLERFLRGEVSIRIEGAAAKLMGTAGGLATPGTPTKPTSYNRKDSTDTNRGSQDLLQNI